MALVAASLRKDLFAASLSKPHVAVSYFLLEIKCDATGQTLTLQRNNKNTKYARRKMRQIYCMILKYLRIFSFFNKTAKQ